MLATQNAWEFHTITSVAHHINCVSVLWGAWGVKEIEFTLGDLVNVVQGNVCSVNIGILFALHL